MYPGLRDGGGGCQITYTVRNRKERIEPEVEVSVPGNILEYYFVSFYSEFHYVGLYISLGDPVVLYWCVSFSMGVGRQLVPSTPVRATIGVWCGEVVWLVTWTAWYCSFSQGRAHRSNFLDDNGTCVQIDSSCCHSPPTRCRVQTLRPATQINATFHGI